MSFRTRTLIISVLLVWIPLVVLAWLTRKETTRMLTEEYEQRVAAVSEILVQDLDGWEEGIHEQLAKLTGQISDDNRFRLAAVEGLEEERAYLLDYAGKAMHLLGFSFLRIQDGRTGRVLSSGHFRNEFDNLSPAIPRLLASAPDGIALVRTRTATGTLLSLASVDSLRLGPRTLQIVGGIEVGKDFLSRLSPTEETAVSLAYPGGAMSSSQDLDEKLKAGVQEEGWKWEDTFPDGRYLIRAVPVPFVLVSETSEPRLVSATFIASQSLDYLTVVIQNLNLWLTGVLLATILGTWILSFWASAGISRPLTDLANKAGKVDFEHLNVNFDTGRKDEIGDLSRLLGAMVRRLKTSAQKIRSVERNATVGEVARQVNHDMRNGLTPIKNIVDRMAQVGKEEPESLPTVWKQQGETLVSSVRYLDELVNTYKRFARRGPRRPCDLNGIVREVVEAREGGEGIKTKLDLTADLPPVWADPVALRRIVDNLAANAEDSFEGKGGTVTFATRWDDSEEMVLLSVADNGRGIPSSELPHVFKDFYTTKPSGTGLGLSIVNRMLTDYQGSIEVESTPGKGTRFLVSLPGTKEREL